jgi:hypothetical protein
MKILLISVDAQVEKTIQEEFNPIKLYEIHSVKTCAEAQMRLEMPDPHYRACICDLDTIEHEWAFTNLLLDYHSRHCFVVCTTDNRSMKCTVAKKLGARLFVDKNDPTVWMKLPRRILRYCFTSMVCQGFDDSKNPRVARFLNLLFEENVRTTTEWARAANSTDRGLRRIFSKGFGVEPKLIVKLFPLLLMAMEYYRAGGRQREENPQKTLDHREYAKVKEFYLTHRSRLERLIAG